MPPSTKYYGFARDCAVCGARIRGTKENPGVPQFEITVMKTWKPGDNMTFPICDYCETHDGPYVADMVHRRIASGAYKVVDGGDGVR